MECKLSIIVPVYNVEKYIESCIFCFVNQKGVSTSDFEVIIVIDGSLDKSEDIINNYDWKDCNHIIYKQKNRGLSGARNSGLDLAKGEYIWFVDSDDTISCDSVVTIFRHITNETVDVLNIGYSEVHNGIETISAEPQNIVDSRELLINGCCVPAPFHIFRREFLIHNKLKFMEGIYHEDMEFTPKCIYLAEKISIVKQILYHYQIRDGSITTTICSKRAFDYLTVASSLIDFGLLQGETMQSTPFSRLICLSINNALYIISQTDKATQTEWIFKFNANPIYTDYLFNSSIFKYKLEGFLFKYLKINEILIYKTLTKFKQIR